MFPPRANRPKVTNFKVYALILMLVPVAFSIKIQPVHALPATFQDNCFNINVKLINVSQPSDGVLLTANCLAINPPGSGLPTVQARPTELDLNGINLNGLALTAPSVPVDTPSKFQNKCINFRINPGTNILTASCLRGLSTINRIPLQVVLQDIANDRGTLVYNYAEDAP